MDAVGERADRARARGFERGAEDSMLQGGWVRIRENHRRARGAGIPGAVDDAGAGGVSAHSHHGGSDSLSHDVPEGSDREADDSVCAVIRVGDHRDADDGEEGEEESDDEVKVDSTHDFIEKDEARINSWMTMNVTHDHERWLQLI